MKKNIIASLVVPLFLLTQSAFAATDYLLKLEGVDGESTKAPVATEPALVAPPPAPPRPAPSPSGDPDFDLLKVAPSPSSPVYKDAGNTEMNPMYEGKTVSAPPAPPQAGKVNIAVGDVDGDGRAETKENNKAGWKVEEGEKLKGVEPDEIDFRDEDDDGDNVPTQDEDLFFSPPTEAQGMYMKLGDVKGEAKEGKEIRKNITINLRAKELRSADEKTKADVLALAPTSTAAVENGDDLALFVLRDATENPAIDTVDIVEDKIVIGREAQGKFLGLFKMSYSERIEIGSEGGVKVRLPWYSFLVNEDLDEEEIALAAKEKKKEKPIQIESWSFGASQAGMYAAVSSKIKASWNLKENVK